MGTLRHIYQGAISSIRVCELFTLFIPYHEKILWFPLECVALDRSSGNVKLVHSLQRLLLKSWYGRLLAVRRVPQEKFDSHTGEVSILERQVPFPTSFSSPVRLTRIMTPTVIDHLPYPRSDRQYPKSDDHG